MMIQDFDHSFYIRVSPWRRPRLSNRGENLRKFAIYLPMSPNIPDFLMKPRCRLMQVSSKFLSGEYRFKVGYLVFINLYLSFYKSIQVFESVGLIFYYFSPYFFFFKNLKFLAFQYTSQLSEST